jgi:hypothetical protein
LTLPEQFLNIEKNFNLEIDCVVTLIRNRRFMLGGLLCTIVFAALLGRRLGWLSLAPRLDNPPARAVTAVATDRERWMKIIQDDRHIGFVHSQLQPTDAGFRLQEKLFMRLNTMGLIQDLQLNYDARLDDTLALNAFNFDMHSGRFSVRVEGQMEGEWLISRIASGGTAKTARLQFDRPPFLPVGILVATAAAGLAPGQTHHFPIFDPATMGQGEVRVTVIEKAPVTIGPQTHEAHKLELVYKGLRQQAWIDNAGGVLKEEGLLGLQQIRSTRDEALKPLSASSDLTRLAAVTPNRPLESPGQLAWLKLRIDGIAPERLPASDPRQSRNGRELLIRREVIPEDHTSLVPAADFEHDLAAAPLVQADDPRIQTLANELTAKARSPRARVQAIMDWMAANIEKRPVLSLPDAVNTLTQRMGDCNEHAVLLAALARAAGIPTQIEAGLVYQRGRFYYHAWNRVHLGRWVTVDALMGQMPADVTHIRLARGDLSEQMEILPMIGRLAITILEAERTS